MSAGWLYLTAMVLAYGVANFLQAKAATKEKKHTSLHPRLLWRLAARKTYVIGVVIQTIGFVLAIAARADLPLFLVQAAVAAGLGVTALLGVAVLKWRLPAAEIVLLIVLSGGVAALVVSAKPSPSENLDAVATACLFGSLAVIAVAGWFVSRKLHGAAGSVALGALAGLAFGAASVASRPLASAVSVSDVLGHPLFYLIIVQSLTGQLLLALAMQRGSTTSAVAAMDAAFAVPAAAVGLLLLGDQIRPGLEPVAVIGFLVTLGAVLALGRYAEPQQHHPSRGAESETESVHTVRTASELDTTTMDFITPVDRRPDPPRQFTRG